MKSVVVIPARYQSSRFPGKPLVRLLGKEMILWVAELSAKAVGAENVYVATDSEKIAEVVSKGGFNFVMTSDSCLTGTDRLSEAASQIEADIFINVQGDEPIIEPQDIARIIEAKKQFPDEVINGYCLLSSGEDPNSVNIPKVIFTEDKRLVYMSRNALPGYKELKNSPTEYYKQVCIYAFNRDELASYSSYGRKSVLENSEDIEIIRFFEWGKTIRMVETQPGSLAVDVPEDVMKVEIALKKIQND